MAKECGVCGKPIGALSSKVKLLDGVAHMDCWKAAGFSNITQDLMTSKQYSTEQLKNIIDQKARDKDLIEQFKPTKQISNRVAFDDNTNTFLITTNYMFSKNSDLFRYEQIVHFELLDDGESITKGGLGRAVIGGALFGGVGAIVGGVTGGKKSKTVCNSLKIKVTLRNCCRQTAYLPFIEVPTKTSSFFYKQAYQQAQEALSALQLAVEKVNTENPKDEQAPVSVTDEIVKFKKLLDDGILSQEEFDAKKKQLLAL